MKPSLLLLCAHLPAPDGTQAGMKCSYHLFRILSRHFQLHILCFATDAERPQYRPESFTIFESHELLPISHRHRITGVLTSPELPVAVGARNSEEFRRRISVLLSRHRFDAVILDHTAMWQYADQLSDIPIVCGLAHDVLTQLWARKQSSAHGVSAWLLGIEARRVRKWEAAAVNRMSMVMTFSEKDASLISALSEGASVFPIQPWFYRLASTSASRDEDSSRRNIVFWGALNRAENQDAVRFALEEILPVVRAQFPNAHFFVAGTVDKKLQETWASPGVTVTGFVEDVSALFSTMDVALLPLRLGAGIKIKVLECMSAGLAVVTTPVGIEGIAASEGTEYLLGQTAEEISAGVIRLLKDPAACRAIGASAQEFVARKFDFEVAAERLSVELISRIKCRALHRNL